MSDDARNWDAIDPRQTFSTPFDAPLVPSGSFRFRDVWILTAIYRTSPEALRRVVPDPLQPSGDVVAIHLYEMNDTEWFGRYNESAVQIGVSMNGHPVGAYSTHLLLDHDGAIATGRELYGQPKKFGKPRLEVRQDLVVGIIERNGIDLVTITSPYKRTRATKDDLLRHLDFVTNVNLKVVPSADMREGFRQLTARELNDVTIHEAWRASGTVELRPHALVPVHRLPVEEVVEVFYWHCDFALGPARIIHDYLPAISTEDGQ